jgi:Ser/Thr protein kinase RdoA (MazF antagonist)
MSFATLEEDEQVARLGRLAGRAVAEWDLPAPRVALLKYRENAVFSVTAADGRRGVLRAHRPGYRSDLDIRSEIAWMRALDAAGVPTPPVIPTRSGDVLTTVAVDGVPEPRQCDLMGWVDGQPPGSLEAGVAASDAALRSLYRDVGALAGRMHALAARWQRPQPFSRPIWNADTLVGEHPAFGPFWELPALDDAQRGVALAARDLVRTRLAALGPADTLIHGDLVPDNILVDGAVTRVIDFDDSGWSWVGLELATSVFPLQVSGGFDAGLAGFLEGYRSIRPFPERDLALLPDLLVARALSYLGWPVGRPEIHSMRPIVPFLASSITEACRRYLEERA